MKEVKYVKLQIIEGKLTGFATDEARPNYEPDKYRRHSEGLSEHDHSVIQWEKTLKPFPVKNESDWMDLIKKGRDNWNEKQIRERLEKGIEIDPKKVKVEIFVEWHEEREDVDVEYLILTSSQVSNPSSTEIIGRVQDRYKELAAYEFDYKSFYNGWLEGRVDWIGSSKTPTTIEKLYYIQNEGYCGNALFWWGEKSKGYVTDIRKAGKFTYDQAKSICQRDEDHAYPCEYIDGLLEAQKLIIDSQYVQKSNEVTF